MSDTDTLASFLHLETEVQTRAAAQKLRESDRKSVV